MAVARNGPPNFPTAVPRRPGAITPRRPRPAPSRATAPRPTPVQVSAARVQARQYASQGRAVERAARAQTARRVAAERASQAKRASRVEVSALRKRTGGAAPILVRRRANIARALAAPVSAPGGAQPKAKGPVKLKGPQPITSRPRPKERKIQQAAVERQAKSPRAIYSADPEVLKKAGFHKPGVAEKLAMSPAAGLVALASAPKDIEELVTTTPTSVAKTATELGGGVVKSVKTGSPKPAAKAVGRVAKQTGEAYAEFVKHPEMFVKRPVTAALMFAPTVKVPGLAAGRVARLAGKQTLERPTAVLEGTTLRQQRLGSRSYFKRRAQAREDVGLPPRPIRRVSVRETIGRKRGTIPEPGPAPKITRHEIERRVDEFQDQAKYHVARVTAKKRKEAEQEFKHLPKAERRAAVEDRAEGAHGGALQEVERRFAREFGSHWQVDPKSGAILKPKQAEHGHIHTDRAHAEKVAERVPFDSHVMELEGPTGNKTYAVVPKAAERRMASHRGVARSKSLGGKLLKTSSRTFRGAVLPLSGKWLAGQVAEAGFRSAIKGAGPTSLLRTRKVIRRMKELEAKGEIPKGSAQALLDRAAAGGQFGKGGVLRFEERGGRTLAEEFAGHRGWEDLAHTLTEIGAKPGVKHVRKGWGAYQRVVFDIVNGAIERTGQKAMLGKAIAESPLMERRLLTLSDKAIDDAARGLKGTHAQVELGRAVDRAYGRYAKFAPDKREMLAHNTPFLPWYQNMAKFLTDVLPNDHPVKASLLAANGKATEDWRKANRVSQYSEDRVPNWLLGTYPLGGDRYRAVGRYLPFSPGAPAEAAGNLLFPQLSGFVIPLARGVDWKGKQIKGGEEAHIREAALALAEAHIPGFSLAGRVSGITPKLRGKEKGPETERSALERLGRSLSPATPIETAESSSGKGTGVRIKPVGVKPVRIKPVRIKP